MQIFSFKVILSFGAKKIFTLSNYKTRAVSCPTQPWGGGEGEKISGYGAKYLSSFFSKFDDN